MKYKELIEKYKKGLASDEEKLIIEQEIEKYEAIEEYITDKIDMSFDDLTKSLDNEQHNEETINLKKSVNNRLRKVVFTSVAIVIALIIGIFFIISPLIDNFYYNPAKVSIGTANNDIDFDIFAYTELNLPGYSLSSNIGIDKLGFGEYNISFSRTNLFTQEMNYVTTKIKRGNKPTDPSEIIWNNNFGFMSVLYPTGMSSEHVVEQKSRVMSHIKQLNSVSYLSSNLTFDKDLTMEELHDLELKYPDVEFIWAGIRTVPHNETRRDLIGIKLISRDSVMITDELIEEKYPAFNILEWLVNPVGYSSSEMSIEAKAYELHYNSLLKYMIDREEATDIFDYPNRMEYYKLALDYAEKHGVKTYGVLVYSNAQDLIQLVENESLKTIELNEVMASKKYIY